MVVWAFLGALVFLILVIAGVLAWARLQVKAQRQSSAGREGRDRLLRQAALAANDASGRELLVLLGALESAGADCPVSVGWVRRPPREAVSEGMLVTITWDGNEWRRVMELAAFRDRVAALVAGDPACANDRARRLLADLSPLPGGGEGA